jgi:threonine dehydrogenase-like Zn-dependent dehydrogenase
MRALVLGDGGLRLDAAYPEPQARGDEALVRVLVAGICGTDLEMLRGYKGFRGVPGHEFVGVVERCGSKPDLVGKRVVGEINVGCRKCGRCRAGDERHCAQRTVVGILGRDGAFAERLAVPVRNLVTVGDTAPATAVFAEPLAAAIRVLEQVRVTDRTRAVVLGPGRIGRLVAMALASRIGNVTLAGRGDDPPRDADLVVDCTGSHDGLARALSIVRPCGTVVLKSTCAGDAPVPLSVLTEIVVREITLVGSRCGTRSDFENACRSLLAGSVGVAPLVEATYGLADFALAFEHAARPGALKVLLDPARR